MSKYALSFNTVLHNTPSTKKLTKIASSKYNTIIKIKLKNTLSYVYSL